MKTYNNYCGNFNMEFVFYNEWADPEIIYKGFVFSEPMISGDLYNMYLEDFGAEPSSDAALTAYIGNHVQDFLDDCLIDFDIEYVYKNAPMNFEYLRNAAVIDAENDGFDYWDAVDKFADDAAVIEHFKGVSFTVDDFC